MQTMATRKKPSERKAERLANEAATSRAYGCKPRPRYRDDPAAWPAEKKRSGKDAWRSYYGYRYRPDAGPEKSLNPSGPGAKFPPAAVAAALVAHEERGHERTAWPSAREAVRPAKPEPARKAAEAAPASDKWPWVATAEKAGKLVAYTAESERGGRRLRAVLYVGEGVCEVREERERGGPWRKLDTHTAGYAAGSAALWEVKRADTAREAVASGVGRMRPAVEVLREAEEREAAEQAADAQAIRTAREMAQDRAFGERMTAQGREPVDAWLKRTGIVVADDVEPPAETPDVAPGTWQRVEPVPAMPGPLAP